MKREREREEPHHHRSFLPFISTFSRIHTQLSRCLEQMFSADDQITLSKSCSHHYFQLGKTVLRTAVRSAVLMLSKHLFLLDLAESGKVQTACCPLTIRSNKSCRIDASRINCSKPPVLAKIPCSLLQSGRESAVLVESSQKNCLFVSLYQKLSLNLHRNNHNPIFCLRFLLLFASIARRPR